jgi:hypothetical protein
MPIHKFMPTYKSKNCAHNETCFSRLEFYIPFVLVAIRRNKVDYWFRKQRIRGPILSSPTNTIIKKFTNLKTPILAMNNNQTIVTNYGY